MINRHFCEGVECDKAARFSVLRDGRARLLCPQRGFASSFDLEWDFEIGLMMIAILDEIPQIGAKVLGQKPARSHFCELAHVHQLMGQERTRTVFDPVASQEDAVANGHPVCSRRQEICSNDSHAFEQLIVQMIERQNLLFIESSLPEGRQSDNVPLRASR